MRLFIPLFLYGCTFSKMKTLSIISFLFCYVSGPQMPKRIEALSAAEIRGDLYTIGGYSPDDAGKKQTEIQKLTCSSRVCTWTTISQSLKVGRSYPVAIPVMDSLCTPTTPSTTTITTTTTSPTTTTTNMISSKKINTNMTVFECLKARSRRIFTD